MRSRKEIEIANEKYSTNDLILEVLLDVRELVYQINCGKELR